jgi:hypothetical protein
METSRSKGGGGQGGMLASLTSLGASTSHLNISFSRGLGASASAHRTANASGQPSFKRQASSYTFHDQAGSVEQHLALLLEDLLKYGSQATVTASEALVLREAFLGLHYVWRMRIHGKLSTLNPELMERLRQALLLFMPRVIMKGPVPFLAKPVPTR